MKKRAHQTTFISLAVIIIAAALTLHFSLPHILSHSLSKTLGTPVTVQGVHLRTHKLVIDDIRVENPPNSQLKYALGIQQLIIDAPLLELLSLQVDIEQIILNKIYVSVEFYTRNRKESNWNTLLDQVNKPVKEMKPGDESAGDQRRIIIKTLKLNDINVELLFAGGKPRMLSPIKHITINDIDPENGLLTEKLTRILTNHIIASVSKGAGISGITGVILDAPAAAVETLFVPFRALFKRNKKNSK